MSKAKNTEKGNDILAALKFVQGSVAKKDFIPALKHFVIEDGTVRGYNGVIALCSPIPFDIACKPRADVLIKAIANCSSTVQLNLTPTGRLSVKSGTFKVFVDCVQEDTPHATPSGQLVAMNGEAFMAGLKAVSPFMSDDASRRWANSVLVQDDSLLATNNVIAVQRWTGVSFPEPTTIPQEAVKEMLRIGEPPIHAQIDGTSSITFHYENGSWLRTQLYDSGQWPNFAKILDAPSFQEPIDEEIFAGLESLKPFMDSSGAVIFNMQQMATHRTEGEGACYDLASLMSEGNYSLEHLLLLKGIAQTIDWSTYPKPCMFTGDMLRGALIGRKPA